MLSLNKKIWLDGFLNCEETHIKVDGMTDDDLNTMIRLLKAQSSSEIEDIPTEVIVSMFEFIPAFANSVRKTTVFLNCGSGNTGSFEQKLLGLPSANLHRKRRVI